MASFYKFTCFYRTAGSYGISSDAAAADRRIGFDSSRCRILIPSDAFGIIGNYITIAQRRQVDAAYHYFRFVFFDLYTVDSFSR